MPDRAAARRIGMRFDCVLCIAKANALNQFASDYAVVLATGPFRAAPGEPEARRPVTPTTFGH